MMLQIFQSLVSEFKALFKAAEGQALMFFIKSVGSAKESTRCKGPAVLVIAALKECLFGEVFISGVVIDNGDGA